MIFAGALGHWPLGSLSDWIDRRKIIIGASGGAAFAGAVLAFSGPLDWSALMVAAGLFGFFCFPIYALSVALTNDFVAQERFVEAAGGLALIWGAGAVLGPIIGSAAIGALGGSALFVLTLLVHLCLAGYGFLRVFRREPPPIGERGVFADAVRVGQTVAPIDVAVGGAPGQAAGPTP